MIVEFAVENYRSIRDRQELSFVPEHGERMEDRVIHAGKNNEDELLPSLFVYGGNASGKSNLCKALKSLRWLTTSSASKLNRGDPIPDADPFRLDPETRLQPTTFEITLLLENGLWRYRVSFNHERIHEESLLRKVDSGQLRWTTIFLRSGDDFTKWKGGAPRINSALFESVRENATILSKAAAERVKIVAPVYDYIRGIAVRDMANPPRDIVTQALQSIENDSGAAQWLARLISCADIPIQSLNVDRQEVEWSDIPAYVREQIEALSDGDVKVAKATLRFVRQGGDGNPISFEMPDESNGTVRFLALALDVLESLKEGTLLVLDEFDASLHSLLAEEVRELMNDPDLNPHGAQFIAVTHNEGLLDATRLRRDQIVFVNRGESRGTEWYAMTDLDRKPRQDESFRRRYINGGYGGVPRVGDLRALILEQLREIDGFKAVN